MRSMHVLEWEMQGGGSAVQFVAARDGDGYALTLSKDGSLALSGIAPDGPTLLRKSQELRSALQQMGYAPARAGEQTPHLAGGPCWGPAPFQPTLLPVLATGRHTTRSAQS